MKIYLNTDFVRYIFRCWPLMPDEWNSKDVGIEYECFDLPDDDVDELCGYMDLDETYSMEDDDEEGRILTQAKRAFVYSQIQFQTK